MVYGNQNPKSWKKKKNPKYAPDLSQFKIYKNSYLTRTIQNHNQVTPNWGRSRQVTRLNRPIAEPFGLWAMHGGNDQVDNNMHGWWKGPTLIIFPNSIVCSHWWDPSSSFSLPTPEIWPLENSPLTFLWKRKRKVWWEPNIPNLFDTNSWIS